MARTGNVVLLIVSMLGTGIVRAGEVPVEPFLGDWQGDQLVAQVIPRGNNSYQINFLPEFDLAEKPLAVVDGCAVDGTLLIDQDGWHGEAKGERLTGSRLVGDNSVPFDLKKVTRPSPRVGARPPRGAVVLFDGSGFDAWEVHRSGTSSADIVWRLVDDFMQVWPVDPETRAGHSLVTRRSFKDFRLHLEFRLPLMADKTGQARANGGIAFEDANWYELQVLDSYGLEGLDNECGGIYKVAAPAVNMCRPPLIWQTYDIEFHAPRYDEKGDRIRPGRISVNHNGKAVHKEVELPDSEKAQKRRKADPTAITAGRIILHYHKDPVEYRNIWLEEL